jgi:hypothetical protein
MSSIATFYIVSAAKRDSFTEARRTEKTVTHKKGILGFGSREIVTGERYLWEFLDLEAASKHDFDHSGFAIVDYFLTFVQLPEPLQAQLTAAASPDGHYFQFEHSLASAIAGYLESHPPDPAALTGFASGQGQDALEYVPLMTATHHALIQWFRGVSPSQFGVLHLTF